MKNKKVKTITGVAMLAAVAVALQYLEVPIPIMPSFIKLDFSDLPELIGAFVFGPLAGVIITLVKNVIHILATQSLGVGELSNFVLGAVFVGTAGIIYKKNSTLLGAVIAGFVGAFAMAGISVVTNYFVIYPLYYSAMGFPQPAVLGMYQAILPSVDSIFEALLIFNAPFTFVKGIICLALAIPIYKPITKALNK